MAHDSIRLPSDSTVASQKTHRGSNLPEALAAAANRDTKTAVKANPLLTVVLKSTPILPGKQDSLFELVLQNDPKSAPPIRLQADTDIKPGTSLLLQLDTAGHYQPVEKPSPEQLKQLIRLELEFWRTQLMPTANLRKQPLLPSTATLMQLAQKLPALAPLIRFLENKPETITGRQVQQLFEQFRTLAHPPVARPAAPTANSAGASWPVKPSDQQPASTAGATASVPDKRPNTATAPLLQLIKPTLIPDFRLARPVGFQPIRFTISGAQQPVSAALRATHATINQPAAQTNTHQSIPGHVGASNPFEQQASRLQFTGQLFQLPENRPENRLILTAENRQQLVFVRSTLGEQTVAKNPTSAAPNPTATWITQPSETVSQKSGAEVASAATPAKSTQLMETAAAAMGPLLRQQGTAEYAMPVTISTSSVRVNKATNQQHMVDTQPSTHPQGVASASHRTSTNPVNNGSAIPLATANAAVASPAAADDLALPAAGNLGKEVAITGKQPSLPLPVEARLSSWLSEIRNAIQQSPAATQASIKQQAEQFLQHPQPNPILTNSEVRKAVKRGETTTDNTEQSLLQLRAAVETTLARLQHAAIQTAAQQWSTPDQPVFHQHLPLIWLGLTHWADIEWWQEQKRQNQAQEKKAQAANTFKMRIFLTLEPLSEFCAELEKTRHITQLTFWTEDQATLAHLHALMPKLEQWTEGLGERQLQTKHGLPKRKTRSESPSNEQHLVDTRI